jgi:predicted DCC family thiol-disulfide oxidoreductase YuxK
MATETLTPPPVAEPFAQRGVVLFDGDCPFCQRSVAILKKLDWLGRLTFQNCRDEAHWPPSAQPLVMSRLLEEMHVVTPDRRRTYAGYAAFRWIAWRLPLTWPVAPFLHISGVPWLGNRVYLWVARRRMNLVPCTDGACAIHARHEAR